MIEHATTDKVIDTGKPGDSTGDLLTWHNKVYDATDTTVAAATRETASGSARSRGPGNAAGSRGWTAGSITVEGPFYDTKDSVIAITGGTGAYASATGDMQLVSKNGGAEYDFIFNLG